MDSLLNVIRAIIDMLPGRCKTINSSFTLWYLPSTPQSASLADNSGQTGVHRVRPRGGRGSPEESVSVMLTKTLGYCLSGELARVFMYLYVRPV